MYEYHGWIGLSVTSKEVDDEDKLLLSIISDVNTLLEKFQEQHRVVGLRVINGLPLIWVASYVNHEGYESE